MKKLLTILMSLVFVVSSCFLITGCGYDRTAELKLAIWGEYIDNDTLTGFQDWYLQQTGKAITVKKTEFDTNETMYTWVATKHLDYDVICPSDYMVERMKNENLLSKLNTTTKNIVQSAVLGEESENQNLVNLITASYDPTFEYSMPYMWGTMGIMYYATGSLDDATNIENQDFQKATWNSLFDVETQNIYMKDSERDTYTVALFNYYYSQLQTASEGFTNFEAEGYQAVLDEIFMLGNNFSTKLTNAQNILLAQKPYVKDYETDEGKDELLNGGGAEGDYGMFWSCDAGYIMAEYLEDSVNYHENFRYIIPEEGSNVWIDNFCIPTYAGNNSAANMFIQYMCNPNVAFDCMDFVGCTTAIAGGANDYYDYLLEDEDFMSCSDSFKSMYLSMMFPYKDILGFEGFEIYSALNRCGIMRDLGAVANDELSIMWSNLRRQS